MSKNSVIKLSSNYFFDAAFYASQKNAVLGIPDSGKTYTATKIAEGLMDAGIPIIVFDPIGVWKNLKIGNGKNTGYPIVVAGGDETCDIVLTVSNVKEIVQAAMKERISLVIDFYSTALANKATWIRVVQSAIEVLLYENRDYGLRHVFIEEAAEFIPQKVQPQQGKVYASIESLARMGRNSGLGLTIINQRAEEVNKAILELCHSTFLHKQVGKNSLLSIQKWLDVRSITNVKKMMDSIPRLQSGHCWVVGMNEDPTMIKVTEKKTFHPSQHKGVPVKTNLTPVDVSAFVKRMNAILQPEEKKADYTLNSGRTKKTIVVATVNSQNDIVKKKDEEIKTLKFEVNLLKGYNDDVLRKLLHMQGMANKAEKKCQEIMSLVNSIKEVKMPVFVKPVVVTANIPRSTVLPSPKKQTDTTEQSQPVRSSKSSSGETRLLQALAMFYPNPTSRRRMCGIAGLKPNSGTTGTYLSNLRSKGWIESDGKEFWVTVDGKANAGFVDKIPSGQQLIEYWKKLIGSTNGAGRMLSYLGSIYPQSISRNELAEVVGLVASSGSFGTYMSTLRGYDLLDQKGNEIALSKEFFG